MLKKYESKIIEAIALLMLSGCISDTTNQEIPISSPIESIIGLNFKLVHPVSILRNGDIKYIVCISNDGTYSYKETTADTNPASAVVNTLLTVEEAEAADETVTTKPAPYGSIWEYSPNHKLKELIVGGRSDKLLRPVSSYYDDKNKLLYVCNIEKETYTTSLLEDINLGSNKDRSSILVYRINNHIASLVKKYYIPKIPKPTSDTKTQTLALSLVQDTAGAGDQSTDTYYSCAQISQLNSGIVIIANPVFKDANSPAIFYIDPRYNSQFIGTWLSYAQIPDMHKNTTAPNTENESGISALSSRNEINNINHVYIMSHETDSRFGDIVTDGFRFLNYTSTEIKFNEESIGKSSRRAIAFKRYTELNDFVIISNSKDKILSANDKCTLYKIDYNYGYSNISLSHLISVIYSNNSICTKY